MQEQTLIEKIHRLPPERIAEVEDFVDFIAQRDSRRHGAARHNEIAAYAAQYAGSNADLDLYAAHTKEVELSVPGAVATGFVAA